MQIYCPIVEYELQKTSLKLNQLHFATKPAAMIYNFLNFTFIAACRVVEHNIAKKIFFLVLISIFKNNNVVILLFKQEESPF